MAPNDPRKAAQDKLAREKKEQLQRQNSQQRIIAAKYNDATNYIKVGLRECKQKQVRFLRLTRNGKIRICQLFRA